ncbi:uroporphyrinogen-III synthase [Brucella sp. IR073]|uniref:uroporphyrinogen-III synthase n=1 Tax=unclassified Brucella TaxID=2632610 RepID=UPI003B987E7B
MVEARRILVTRPEPGASRTARRLDEMGYAPVVLPLSETVPIAAKLPPGRYDAVAVTSVNALRHADPASIQKLLHLPVFAVGEKTAGAARAAGFSNVTAAGGDGAALAQTLAVTLKGQANVLYLAGRVRRSDFEEKAVAAGLLLAVCETYDTAPIDYGDLRQRLGDAPFDAALVYSIFAAEALAALAERAELPENFLRQTQFLCLSPRISESLPAQWQARALVAARPDEQALFNLLAAL